MVQTIVLFQSVGTDKNDLDLDLMICRQAEEEFLRVRREENEIEENYKGSFQRTKDAGINALEKLKE